MKKLFRKLFTAVAFTAIGIVCSQAGTLRAQLIDDFSGPLTGYTSTVILDNNGGASNTANWQISGGKLELITTVFDTGSVEQYAYIRNNLALSVGQEVQADFADPILGNRNMGLYVGGTAPTTGVRQDYISVYGGTGGATTPSRIFQRGFDGTTEYANLFADPTGTVSSLFIARTAVNTYESGFYDTSGRKIVSTLVTGTLANGVVNTGGFVGFYADVRAAGIVGNADNFRIFTAVPEPGSLIVLGLTGLAILVRRRK